MSDLRTLWQPEALSADWLTGAGGLGAGRDLESAVIISLFSDRLAEPDDRLPDGVADRRGWWADGPAPAARLGSRIWLLCREKQTEQTRRRAEDYAREALAWLVRQRIVRRVTVASEWQPGGRLALLVTLDRPDGSPVAFRFAELWDQLGR